MEISLSPFILYCSMLRARSRQFSSSSGRKLFQSLQVASKCFLSNLEHSALLTVTFKIKNLRPLTEHSVIPKKRRHRSYRPIETFDLVLLRLSSDRLPVHVVIVEVVMKLKNDTAHPDMLMYVSFRFCACLCLRMCL